MGGGQEEPHYSHPGAGGKGGGLEGRGRAAPCPWATGSGAGGQPGSSLHGTSGRPLPCTPPHLPLSPPPVRFQTAGSRSDPRRGQLLRNSVLRKHALAWGQRCCLDNGRAVNSVQGAADGARSQACCLALTRFPWSESAKHADTHVHVCVQQCAWRGVFAPGVEYKCPRGPEHGAPEEGVCSCHVSICVCRGGCCGLWAWIGS